MERNTSIYNPHLIFYYFTTLRGRKRSNIKAIAHSQAVTQTSDICYNPHGNAFYTMGKNSLHALREYLVL